MVDSANRDFVLSLHQLFFIFLAYFSGLLAIFHFLTGRADVGVMTEMTYHRFVLFSWYIIVVYLQFFIFSQVELMLEL